MHMSIYVRNGVVYMPTVIETNGALSRSVEPVTIVAAAEREKLRSSIQDQYARGNVVIARLPRSTGELLPSLAASARVKSWSAFYRGSASWLLYVHEGLFNLQGWRPRKGRGLEPDPVQKTVFPPGTAFDVVCDHVIEVIQAAAAKQVSPASEA